MFFIRKFGITGGFHRYFSHRSYKTSRPFQFASLSWAVPRRRRARSGGRPIIAITISHSDTEDDLHSAKLEGFYWSHVGWVLSKEYEEYDQRRSRI